MTPIDAARLLAIAASFDNRKPDADATLAWSVVLDGVRFEDARDVIVAHYRVSTDWLMPAHIITAVRKLRDKRLAEAPVLTPPPDLTPLETIDWLKDRRRRQADGETVDEAEGRGELLERHLPELRALIQRGPVKPEPEPLLTDADHSREPEPAGTTHERQEATT